MIKGAELNIQRLFLWKDINRGQTIIYALLWLPSQKGGFFVFLQPQSTWFFFSVTENLNGTKSVPSCEPSHIGWLFDLPQEHQ